MPPPICFHSFLTAFQSSSLLLLRIALPDKIRQQLLLQALLSKELRIKHEAWHVTRCLPREMGAEVVCAAFGSGLSAFGHALLHSPSSASCELEPDYDLDSNM